MSGPIQDVSHPTVRLPRPRRHQLPSLAAPERFKLFRWGRRVGKGIAALLGATLGHGPDAQGAPVHRGWLFGGVVAWIGLDYTQTEKIWRQEFKPRFEGVPGFKVEESAFRIVAPVGPNGTQGEITLYTANNVETLLGSKLDGVVCDEFAHWAGDPEDAWRRILRPTLIDRAGWAIFPSTPWPGSYFDSLCKRHDAGELRRTWFQSHIRTKDADQLNPEEVAEVYAEYAPGDPRVQTELEALLITGGAGVAFPEFVSEPERRVHVVRPAPIPPYYRIVAGLDWGWRTGVVVTCALGPEGEVIVIHELPLAELHAEAAGRFYCDTLLDQGVPLPALVCYDLQMDADAGIKVGSSLASEFREGMAAAVRHNPDATPRMQAAAKGPGSRIAGKNMVHKALAWKDSRDPEGRLQPWASPRFRVFTSCPYTIRVLGNLPNSPKILGDVDTDADDHPYDAVRYLLAVKAAGGEMPEEDTPQDRHPGFRHDGALQRRRQPAPWEQAPAAGYTDPSAERFWDPARDPHDTDED